METTVFNVQYFTYSAFKIYKVTFVAILEAKHCYKITYLYCKHAVRQQSLHFRHQKQPLIL